VLSDLMAFLLYFLAVVLMMLDARLIAIAALRIAVVLDQEEMDEK